MSTEFYVGTSGYAYREWKGSFYPEDLPAKKMLTASRKNGWCLYCAR